MSKARLEQRPTYQGLAVPYVVAVGADGRPDFGRLERSRECLLHHLCSMCGAPLDSWQWFVGTHVVRDGAVYSQEPGMHETCMVYSLAHRLNLNTDIGKGLTVWASYGYVLAPGPKGSAVLVARLQTPEEYRVTPHDGGVALVGVSAIKTIAARGDAAPPVKLLRLPQL